MTGAPGSHQRTWANDDMFRLLFLEGATRSKVKMVVGFARLFRPRYAGANLDFLLRSTRQNRVCGFH